MGTTLNNEDKEAKISMYLLCIPNIESSCPNQQDNIDAQDRENHTENQMVLSEFNKSF